MPAMLRTTARLPRGEQTTHDERDVAAHAVASAGLSL
jgi:hypothetical protein